MPWAHAHTASVSTLVCLYECSSQKHSVTLIFFNFPLAVSIVNLVSVWTSFLVFHLFTWSMRMPSWFPGGSPPLYHLLAAVLCHCDVNGNQRFLCSFDSSLWQTHFIHLINTVESKSLKPLSQSFDDLTAFVCLYGTESRKPCLAEVHVLFTSLIITCRLAYLRFDLCTRAIVCLSSMASEVAQGSDSHDAPLLFVLPCESSARLCLPLSFLSARCLRGKVSLSSFSSTSELSHSFIHSSIPIGHCCPFLSLLLLPCVAFYVPTWFVHSSLAPRPRCQTTQHLLFFFFLWLSRSSEHLWSHSCCLLS